MVAWSGTFTTRSIPVELYRESSSAEPSQSSPHPQRRAWPAACFPCNGRPDIAVAAIWWHTVIVLVPEGPVPEGYPVQAFDAPALD